MLPLTMASRKTTSSTNSGAEKGLLMRGGKQCMPSADEDDREAWAVGEGLPEATR